MQITKEPRALARAALTMRETPSMPTGTVKWFDPRQGYGYIIPDDGSQDVFVHQSQLEMPNPPDEGQPVIYELQSSPKGPIAISVHRADAHS